ncbi:MAG: hypothetical protein U5K29_05090 [Acidimicrobiales bacterium]|nr:hypothetical protein [Acidimicrobiales bacterium]
MRASVAASMAGKAAEMVTLLVLAVVVPRVLGAQDFGAFSVPLTVVTLGSLALTLGGPTVMARYVPASSPEERVAVARAIGARLARGRALQVGFVGVVAVLLVAARPDTFPALETGFVVAALALNVVATLALQMGLGLGRTGAWSMRYPLQNVVLITAVLLLHPAGRVGSIGAILVAAGVAAVFAVFMVAPFLRAPAPQVPVPDGVIRFGVLHATGAALVQVSQRGGVLVVAVLTGSAAETGYVALATGIALGVTYAVLQAFTVSLPHLADASPDGAVITRAPEEILRRLGGGLLAVLIPATAAVALLLDELVPRVFGSDYLGSIDAFGPALALIVLAPLNAVAVQAGALRLRPEAAARAGGASAIVFAVVAVVAVPHWGAAGGTTAALAGAAATAVAGIVQLPGAFGSRLVVASFAGAGLVLALAALS